MIEQFVREVFEKIGHTWKISGVQMLPEEEDVTVVLDEAARVLYTEHIGTQYKTGGLIIEKANDGHDVYVFVGNYQ